MKKKIPNTFTSSLFTFLWILLSANLIFGQQTGSKNKFGFSMAEPKNWIAASSEDLKENLGNFEIDEKKLAQMLKTANKAILITAFYKYNPEEKEGLIPKIQVDALPNNTKNFDHFKASITKSAENLKQHFADLEFIRPPEEIEISGVKSIFQIIKFSVKMTDGTVLKVRSRVYAIPYKSYFFQVNMVDGQFEEDNSAFFDELVKTIKIGV